MHILVVAATTPEIEPLVRSAVERRVGRTLKRARYDSPARYDDDVSRMATYTRGGHDIDVLTTGVGMVATAARCSRVLARGKYNLALNLGVCGSFDPALAPGRVVHVVTDRLPELGAEDGDADGAFLTIEELQLLGENEFPFQGGRLVNAAPPANTVLSALPAVHGITVNTVHGNDASIAAIARRCAPQVESMEGAAFMYACLIHGVPFAQVRAVSNIVEKRNRASWKIAEAIAALGETALGILDHA